MNRLLIPLPGNARWKPVERVCPDCGANLRVKQKHCENLPPAHAVEKDNLPPDAYIVFSGGKVHTGTGRYPNRGAENVETVRLKLKFRPFPLKKGGRLYYEEWILMEADPETALVVIAEAQPEGLPPSEDLWDLIDGLVPTVMEKRQEGVEIL